MKPCLSHERKKPDGFQCDGLTTGIRTGDDKKVEILTEIYVYRNNLFCFNKRMTSFFNIDVAVLIHYRFAAIVPF